MSRSGTIRSERSVTKAVKKWWKGCFLAYLAVEVISQFGGRTANGRCTCPFCTALNFLDGKAQSQNLPSSTASGGGTAA